MSPLAPLRGTQNADAYITTLDKTLLPFMQSLPQHVQNSFIFQQDNAHIHTAQKTMNWFREKSIIVMEWLLNSPNMNPIEHLWYCLKTQLHKRFPDTPILRGGLETIK